MLQFEATFVSAMVFPFNWKKGESPLSVEW